MNSGLYQFADNVIHTSDKDLGAETVAAVVITGLAVVFIGLILLIALVWLYGKIFQVINDKAAKKAAAAAAAKSEAKAEKAPAPAPAPGSGCYSGGHCGLRCADRQKACCKKHQKCRRRQRQQTC